MRGAVFILSIALLGCSPSVEENAATTGTATASATGTGGAAASSTPASSSSSASSGGGGSGPIPGDAWRSFAHDAGRTGRSKTRISDAPTLVWTAEADGGPEAMTSPVIDDEGTVYVEAGWSIQMGSTLYAFNRLGALLWSAAEPPPLPQPNSPRGFGSPAIAPDNSIVITAANQIVMGFAADGSVKFQTMLPDTGMYPTVGDATVAADGSIYAVTESADSPPLLHAVSPMGDVLWSLPLGDTWSDGFGYVTIADDGSMYAVITGNDDLVAKFTPDGQIVWQMPSSRPTPASIGTDGRLWFATSNSTLLAVSPAGTTIFTSSANAFGTLADAPIAVGLTNSIYVESSEGIWNVDSNGNVAWHIPASGPKHHYAYAAFGSGALDAAGTYVFCDSGGVLRGVRDGAKVFSLHAASGALCDGQSATAIGPDGTIVAVGGEKLYAFR